MSKTFECPACGKQMDRENFGRKLDEFKGRQRCKEQECVGAWCTEEDLSAAFAELNA
jgi:hypothetical protein